MKDKDVINVINVSIEYGKESLNQIILKLLKEEYINYITILEKKCKRCPCIVCKLCYS